MSDGLRGAPPRVLAVEDNPGDVWLLEEGIAAVDADLDLDVCNNGRQAIDRLAEPAGDRPSLILLDLNLPGKSGFEVLDAIRDDPEFDRIPVLVVSSSDNPEDIRRAYERAANAYVRKPADPDDYIEMVVAAVRFWIPAVTTPTDR